MRIAIIFLITALISIFRTNAITDHIILIKFNIPVENKKLRA